MTRVSPSLSRSARARGASPRARRSTCARRTRGPAALAVAALLVAALLMGPTSASAAPPEGASGPAPGTIALSERRPLAFILLAPSGELSSTSTSELIRKLGAALERSTDLFVDAVDASLVADCGGELGCMVQKLRAGGARAEPARLLLVLSMLGRGKKGDRASATLVDVPTAFDEYGRVSRDDPDWQTAAEALIADRAVRAKTPWVELRDGAEAARFVEDLVDRDLREGLEAAGSWEPYGQLDLTNLGPGWTIELDGAAVGSTRSEATTHLTGVRAGPRTLVLARAGYAPIEATLTVERGRATRYDADPKPLSRGSPLARKAVLFGGAGVAAAGAVVLGTALARQNGDVVIYCLGAPGGRCASASQFQTLGYSTSGLPTFEDRVNPSGVLLAPLGYSLLATGAVWSLGTLAFTEDGDVPWLELVAGVAAGALAYGLSAALDGETAFAR